MPSGWLNQHAWAREAERSQTHLAPPLYRAHNYLMDATPYTKLSDAQREALRFVTRTGAQLRGRKNTLESLWRMGFATHTARSYRRDRGTGDHAWVETKWYRDYFVTRAGVVAAMNNTDYDVSISLKGSTATVAPAGPGKWLITATSTITGDRLETPTTGPKAFRALCAALRGGARVFGTRVSYGATR
jgi:hypothetical protein